MVNKFKEIKHLAITMDGNRRWGIKHRSDPYKGHGEGAKTLRKILEFCQKEGIKILTVYALSLDNLKKRSKKELAEHFRLHKKYIKEEILNKGSGFVKNKTRFNVLGRINLLPKDEQELIHRAIEKTKNFSKCIFNVCLAYDGQEEIVDAVKKILIKKTNPNTINKKTIKQQLYTKDIPPPDIIIRTGMNPEQRLSGCLLFDSSYSELAFTKTLWPDFNEIELTKILNTLHQRQRRFGK